MTAANQAGSNFGSCVDVWAPGKDIGSAWKTVQQNPPTLGDEHVLLSGTSMAAPHIAAVAAYAGTLWGATTPAQIESMIRGLGYPLGSTAENGAAIYTVNLTGTRPTAIPTAVFALNGGTGDRIGTQGLQSGEPFNLQYDSVGAVSCTLTGYLNGAVWYQIPNFLVSYDWGSATLLTGSYQWTVDCVSGSGTHNTATIRADVLPPAPPTAKFYINQMEQPNGSTYYYQYDPQHPVYFSYSSSQETNCDLTVQKGPVGGSLSFWYDYPGLGTSFSWGNVTWAPYWYRYRIDCYGGPAGPISATLDIVSYL